MAFSVSQSLHGGIAEDSHQTTTPTMVAPET